MFKVYIVHEIGDYGLWDMTDAKVFSKFKDAEAYNGEYYKQHGHTLVITEWDVEQAKHNTYIHGIKIMNMKQITKQPVIVFQVGDRVQFYTSINERGMSNWKSTEYGIITKMNKVTVVVKTKTDEWKINLSELTHYVDPFSGWGVAE